MWKGGDGGERGNGGGLHVYVWTLWREGMHASWLCSCCVYVVTYCVRHVLHAVQLYSTKGYTVEYVHAYLHTYLLYVCMYTPLTPSGAALHQRITTPPRHIVHLPPIHTPITSSHPSSESSHLPSKTRDTYLSMKIHTPRAYRVQYISEAQH